MSLIGSSSCLVRLTLAGIAFASLAACSQSGALTPPNSSGATPPTVTLQSIPSKVAKGQPTTLKWDAKNADKCTASGGWSGTQPTSGALKTSPLTGTTSYALTCSGSSGTASQSAEVIVTAAAPTVTFTAAPTTVSSGGASDLTWNSSDATTCMASGGWSGPVAISGTWSTGALTNTTEYDLTCTGDGGSSTQSVTVTVPALPPVVTLSANPYTVSSGSASILTWTSTNSTSCTASGAWSGNLAQSGSASTGSLTSNATFTLTCSGDGGSASQSATVTVTSPAPIIGLNAAPSTIKSGKSSILTWSAANATTCSASGGWSGNKAVSGSQSTGVLTASATYTLTCSGDGGVAAQSTTVTVTPPAPTVSLSVGPSAITSGKSATLTWSSTDATSCTASGAWSGSEPLSGSQSTGALTTTSTYTLKCGGPGGNAAQSATVTVSPKPTVTVSFNASPSTVDSGASSLLTWSSSNATTCTASGGWSGSKALSGSQSTGALTADTTYTLSCTGTDGSASQSATVSVTPPAPTVNLSAVPSTIASGASSTLTWSSANATSCTASGAWSGNEALNGSQSTGALTADATYTLTCTGTGGSASQSATVSVTQPAPTVSFTASPSTVASGGNSTLNWSATHATSCNASGAWSGNRAVSGSQSTGALTASATYTLTCSGAGGSASQSATVSVSAPAPSVTLTANPSTVASGATSNLTWSSTNATTCTASGSWSGSEGTSGSQSTGALTATAKYKLTCTGAGGSASQSATVTVTGATGKATLTWIAPSTNTDGSPVTPLSGFTIYYGTVANALTESVVVTGATTTTYVITGLAAGTWYFGVAANAADGTQSAVSNVGSKTI